MQQFDQRQTERSVHAALATYLHGEGWKSIPGVDQEAATSLLKIFLDASHREFGVKPEQLSPDQLREILLDRLPRRLSAKRRAAGHAVEVVRSFFEHLAADPGRGFSLTAELDRQLTEAAALFPQVLRGEKQVEVKKAQPLRRAEGEPGRNDPCPCGSGKKYKKCCLKEDAA